MILGRERITAAQAIERLVGIASAGIEGSQVGLWTHRRVRHRRARAADRAAGPGPVRTRDYDQRGRPAPPDMPRGIRGLTGWTAHGLHGRPELMGLGVDALLSSGNTRSPGFRHNSASSARDYPAFLD
jgi:hypothetical protein